MHSRSGTDIFIEYNKPYIDLTAQHGATRRGLTLDMIMDLTVIHMSNHDMAIITIEQKTLSLRLRGSGDPNNDSKFNDIPYLTNMRFEWDGLPCLDFGEKILNPLNNGLGSMNVKGATLLETVQERDGLT